MSVVVTCVCVCEDNSHPFSGGKSREAWGKASADRDNKDTLLFTAPRSIAKSSTEDLKPSMPEIIIRPILLLSGSCRPLGRHGQFFMVSGLAPYYCLCTPKQARYYHHSRVDSSLEAFSFNPTDDSFASLSVRINAIPNVRINGSSRTKSNYCLDGIINKFISRVKLTCLTTV